MDVDWVNTRKRFDSSPYALSMGIKLVELTTGYAKVELKLKDEFRNWDGRVQGGVIVSLLDRHSALQSTPLTASTLLFN